MAELVLEGIFAPLTTPFDEAGDVDLGALRRNLQGYAAAPLAGYVALGTNGEFVHLGRAEKEAVIAAAVDGAAGRPVLAQVGEGSLRETAAFARRAADLGAAAVLAVTPHYYRGRMDDEALVDFYHALGDASPVPVLLYNIPQNTGVNIPAAVVCRLAEHPNIIGIKDSSGNYGQLLDIIAGTPEGWGVTTGAASMVFAALASGGRGAILAAANALPFEYCDIHRLVREGDLQGAAEHQRRLQRVGNLLSKHGIPGTKAAMDLLGYAGRHPRLPMLPCSDAARDEILNALREAQLVRL